MKILCVGVNHQSAPLEWREQLAFDRQATARALAILRTRHEQAEFAILSTCNRVEVYCVTPAEAAPRWDELECFMADFHGIPCEELRRHDFRLDDEPAVRHLLEVTASLDSMVVGESQIIGQVKEAFLWAVEAEATGKYLNRLFHRAFGTAKRIHSATEIGHRHTSVAAVAVDFAARIFSGLESKRVLVIGAGEMAELAIISLRAAGCREVSVINRTAERGAALAATFQARTRPWNELDLALAESDIVVCSTGSPDPILRREQLAEAHRRRQFANWMILDLAVPRNVEPEAAGLRNVYLYDLDAIGRVVSENICLRENELDLAMEIVGDEVRAFMDWFESREVGPLVERLETRLHGLGDEELERLFKRLPPEVDAASRREIALATHRIVHKLLHHPIERLKAEARQDQAQMSLRVLRRLFDLDDEPGQ